MNTQYYDGTKLLSMQDINGRKPEIYMVTTNRTGGKTTFFNRLAVNRFIKKRQKFCVLYRYNYEVNDVVDKFYKDIGELFFPDHVMTSKREADGIYHELYLDDISCGYSVSINSADMIKKYSHMFSDVELMIFDEFQSETNHYCSDEIKKFLSIHTSMARGHGKQVRYVPVIMMSNPVSIINPYYVQMGISSRLRDDTRFLRGDGFVLEQGFVESASAAQQDSAFNRAFATNDYVAYSSQAVYLNDSKTFIEKPAGKSRYICTLKYNSSEYGVREFSEAGFMYCDDRPDRSHPTRISVTTEDHDINYVMLKRNDFFLANLRYLFERGCFRFKDLRCKEAVLSALSY